jgi:hypothetical protein
MSGARHAVLQMGAVEDQPGAKGALRILPNGVTSPSSETATNEMSLPFETTLTNGHHGTNEATAFSTRSDRRHDTGSRVRKTVTLMRKGRAAA